MCVNNIWFYFPKYSFDLLFDRAPVNGHCKSSTSCPIYSVYFRERFANVIVGIFASEGYFMAAI